MTSHIHHPKAKSPSC